MKNAPSRVAQVCAPGWQRRTNATVGRTVDRVVVDVQVAAPVAPPGRVGVRLVPEHAPAPWQRTQFAMKIGRTSFSYDGVRRRRGRAGAGPGGQHQHARAKSCSWRSRLFSGDGIRQPAIDDQLFVRAERGRRRGRHAQVQLGGRSADTRSSGPRERGHRVVWAPSLQDGSNAPRRRDCSPPVVVVIEVAVGRDVDHLAVGRLTVEHAPRAVAAHAVARRGSV